mmetsp:Transcript_32739/g.76122  ORF Transcript_32739/g.76122 Transcript_32739/m.76122 type:complete len:343 (-) Transcript_32739:60-1088(-)
MDKAQYVLANWRVLRVSVMVAIAAAVVGVVLKLLERNNILGLSRLMDLWANEDDAYKSFQGVLGFFLIFRTSQGYARYMEAGNLLHQMQGSFFEAFSSIMAFLKMSKANTHEVREFTRLLATLFSMLSALSLRALQISPGSERVTEDVRELNILGAEALSEETILAVSTASYEVALLDHWIQSAIMEQVSNKVLNAPPPIVSRAFNELADGMVKFEDCIKLIVMPFPIPYTQTTSWCLLLHWFLTPFHLCALCKQPAMVGIYTFVNVFAFWCMYTLASEMENPFGDDELDLDLPYFQRKMNSQLLLLLSGQGSQPPLLLPRGEGMTPTVGRLCRLQTGSRLP